MTPKQIKIILIEQNKTVADLARRCHNRLGKPVSRVQVSMCIHRRREYLEIREVLAAELGIPVERLFENGMSKSTV